MKSNNQYTVGHDTFVYIHVKLYMYRERENKLYISIYNNILLLSPLLVETYIYIYIYSKLFIYSLLFYITIISGIINILTNISITNSIFCLNL